MSENIQQELFSAHAFCSRLLQQQEKTRYEETGACWKGKRSLPTHLVLTTAVVDKEVTECSANALAADGKKVLCDP